MGLANEMRKASVGGDYTAIDVADWLAEQQNAAARAGDAARATTVWALMKAWSVKVASD